MSLDLVRFADGPVEGEHVLWTGPWPPDERIGVAVGRTTGIVRYFDPESPGFDVDAASVVAEIVFYRRRAASQLPDGIESPHVARAAEYVVERSR